LYRFVSNSPVNYRDWLGLAIEAGTGIPDDSDYHDGDGVSSENDSNPYSYDYDPLASIMSGAVDFVEDAFDYLYSGVKYFFNSM
jgi:hypothetical protein